MILNSPFPEDIRVRKEILALQPQGIQILLLCLRRTGESAIESREALTMHKIDAGKSNYGLAFWDVIMSIFFIHPVFYFKANKLIRQYGINIVHVHDLPLVGTGLLLKRKNSGLKVIFDMHENYPEALPLWFAWKKGPVVRLKNKLFMNTRRWLKWEKKAVTESDHILAVVDEMRDNVIVKYPNSVSKITVVSNTESEDFLAQPLDPDIYGSLSGKFIIAYVGGLGPHRGVDTAVQAMVKVNSPDIVLAIVGGGSPDAVAELQNQIKELDLADRVFLLGQQPFSKVFSFMKMAEVNLIPHKKNTQNEHGVPHKLFQSMMTGKPLLVSSCRPLTRIVTESEAGLVFHADNSVDLAEKIERLYRDHELRSRLGTNGYRASTHGEFSWKKSAENLIQTYRDLS